MEDYISVDPQDVRAGRSLGYHLSPHRGGKLGSEVAQGHVDIDW